MRGVRINKRSWNLSVNSPSLDDFTLADAELER